MNLKNQLMMNSLMDYLGLFMVLHCFCRCEFIRT